MQNSCAKPSEHVTLVSSIPICVVRYSGSTSASFLAIR